MSTGLILNPNLLVPRLTEQWKIVNISNPGQFNLELKAEFVHQFETSLKIWIVIIIETVSDCVTEILAV